MELLFWVSVLFVAYTYAGYPILLFLWSSLVRRPVRKRSNIGGGTWPTVSVVIAAHNEARHLPGRLRNLLEQRYAGAVEIIVVSDGSTDSTPAVVRSFAGRIRTLEVPRGGKPSALNAGVATATSEILVFADARQRFDRDAIAELVANFDDPRVGGVTGALILDCEQDSAAVQSSAGEGVGLYWRYEKWLRRHESRIGSTLGATGAIYAMRRSLWQPLPPETLLDDVLAPMRIVLTGSRVVFDEHARALDRVVADNRAESRRKTRTLAGNYQILWLEPRLLIPFVNPVWLQYMSHKVGRLVVPWALISLLLTSLLLATSHQVYAVALILQLGFYGLAALGGWMESRACTSTGTSDELPLDSASDKPGQPIRAFRP
jgi:cellulose synthase/poly-beta-1,6-N-acetylglucosamine synthase-like glycosyltransferase